MLVTRCEQQYTMIVILLLLDARYCQAIYAAVRDEEAADLTKKLADRPALPKRRWAYALKDTSTRETTRVG